MAAPTPKKLGPALSICLEADRQSYAGGDIIVGQVRREAPIVSPSAEVTVRLHGRCKARILHDSIDSGTDGTVSKGFRLIDQLATVQCLHQGPVHLPEGGDALTWPFYMPIPTHVNFKILTRGVTSADSYLPLDAESVASQTLPPTLNDQRAGVSADVEGTIEYLLDAELHSTGQGASVRDEALLPITLVTYSEEPPIINFKPKSSLRRCMISSQRLLPGMENVKLSGSQKLKKFFGTRSVPDLVFMVEAQVPTVLQLENPDALPFGLRIVPRREETSKVIQDAPQQVTLTKAGLKIIADTEVITEGRLGPETSGTSTEMDLHIGDLLVALKQSDLQIPYGEKSSFLDLGELINLRVGYKGALGLKSLEMYHISPSQVTYNIRQKHRLRWDICGVVAGERFEAWGIEKITVLPESGP